MLALASILAACQPEPQPTPAPITSAASTQQPSAVPSVPGPASSASASAEARAPEPASSAPIGAATMEPDGTIVLQLRAEGPHGIHGDALLRYPKTDARYKKVLAHLGGLVPGQSKPVPPWPDELVVSKGGTKLGTIVVQPGGPGVLTLASQSEDAKALKKRWDELAASDTLRIKLQAFKRGEAQYGEGVRMVLLDAGYEVEDAP